MTQREFAAATGSKQSTISPAETGVTRHPALLLERLRASGFLPPEREEQFLKDWARWLRWIDSRKVARADIARFVDELAADQLGPCVKLIGERLTRITLDPVGPNAL
ncbi:hypothetical protein JST97_24225 [bacterium]|nr:hypothetical protein [bacterium]